jgi:small subunit ribosomal protein S26e
MPISTAPYKREYKQTKSRGSQQMVECDSCGRKVPRHKTFSKMKGMRIRDPALLQQMDKRMIHLMQKKVRYCPACARHRKISKPGVSSRKKYEGREKSFRRRR